MKDLLFHHSGFVIKDLAKYEKRLIFSEKIKEIIDPIQEAKLALYDHFGAGYIELIQPLSEDAFTYNFLDKTGGGFHHFCYEIASKSQLDEVVAKYRLLFIRGPLEAVLFDKKKVYFYYTRNRQIVEFLVNE